MARVCTKQMWALSWAGLECLLFAGVVLGWPWFLHVFRTDRYFSRLCNNTNDTYLGIVGEPQMDSMYRTITARPKPPCRPRRPRKRETEYRETFSLKKVIQSRDVHDKNSSSLDAHLVRVVTNSSHVQSDDVTRNSIGCAEQSSQMYVLFALVLIIRDVLALPIGIFFDKYGTTRTRLLTVYV